VKKYTILFYCIYLSLSMQAQIKRYASSADSIYFSNTQYRLVGPFRGGRASGVCGSLINKQTFYMGTTGGGVWRTSDGGSNWHNISDNYFGGSIGCVSIAPSNENIIYVGEGENTMRGNVSEGINGIWKSENAGRTWKNMGLQNGRHITNILVHPRNENIVWACVMGSLFGPSKDRGVYKTIDGGKSWRQVLYSGHPQAGAVEINMEPNNPDVLYASTWNMKRTPYNMESGGAGSALWKSMDGGESWTNISRNKGLPKDSIIGISHIVVAPSNPDRVYAIVEAKNGGLFKSDDAGLTWTLQSSDANIRQRAWYFSKINVDPKNQDLVYACNVEFWKSSNAGKNWTRVYTPHGDHHNLWIDPNDGKRMIIADDGGAQVSYDGGDNWSSYYNQPTSQIYRISADNAWPYHLLGGQQDNSSIRIDSRSKGGSIAYNNFKPTAGGEAGVDVADPLDPYIVYGGEYAGILRRYDHRTDEVRHINVWPESNIGSGAANLKYRFQWNYPLFFSPHNPKRLYAAGNCLFVSENEGLSWKALSGDLTTDNKSKQAASGGPITKDNTTVEYYCTIFAATESVIEKDVLYAGSDDGLLHVSRNGGGEWRKINAANMPADMMWNCIETDPFTKGMVYAVGTKYKSNDFTPYLYKSNDYGNSWQLITNGIPKNHFTRVLRADRKRKDLLYCGTEYGLYISYDGGSNWKPFHLNMPIVPITDMCIKHNDLCIATQGRAFWILDNLEMVQAYNTNVLDKNMHAFPVDDYIFSPGYKAEAPKNAGSNPDNGVSINYWLKDVNDSTNVIIKILDANHNLINTYKKDAEENYKLKFEKGMNRLVWDAHYPVEEIVKDMVLWNGPLYEGAAAVPGKYFAQVITGKDSTEIPFNLLANPTYTTTTAAYQERFDFLMQVKKEFDSVQKSIKQIRNIRNQVNSFTDRNKTKVPESIKSLCDSINTQLTQVEEALFQTKAKSGQDVLNYPIKLNDKIAALYNDVNGGESGVAQQYKEVFAYLVKETEPYLLKLQKVKTKDLAELNRLIKASDLNLISGD
jgi:photosystem II stability/assembly factor-like uncharacterized protein